MRITRFIYPKCEQIPEILTLNVPDGSLAWIVFTTIKPTFRLSEKHAAEVDHLISFYMHKRVYTCINICLCVCTYIDISLYI